MKLSEFLSVDYEFLSIEHSFDVLCLPGEYFDGEWFLGDRKGDLLLSCLMLVYYLLL